MNKKLLFSLLIFALLSVLLGACKIIDASTLPKAKLVHMGSSNFIEQEVTINKGESVNLVNGPASNHVISNGQWVNGVAQPKTEANAPTESSANVAASASLVVGPFAVAGTYHLYCTIHPGMNLVVQVK